MVLQRAASVEILGVGHASISESLIKISGRFKAAGDGVDERLVIHGVLPWR